ncbi:MAG: tolB protein precursor, periplasmic protein involved in the tonb-independent uptake of group A colicins, partial [uncultured Gemmatimonadaceae bacterium]
GHSPYAVAGSHRAGAPERVRLQLREAGRRRSAAAHGHLVTRHSSPVGAAVRAPPRQRPPPHERRGERRGVLEPRRPATHPPEQARRLRLRPAVRDERRRVGGAARVDRDGQDHVRLLLRRRPARAVRLHTRRRAQLPRPPRPVARLRLG